VDDRIKILVVGCGHMGSSHAQSYHKMEEFEIVGLVSRGPESRKRLSRLLGGIAEFGSIGTALKKTRPDAVSINTYPDSHAEYTIESLEAGAHVFVEKPIAQDVSKAEAVAHAAARTGKKVVVGYILRHHPSWEKFIEIGRTLGKPLVMRMNLNQQSSGKSWTGHKNLMKSISPIVDCGVHYVDVMCQVSRATPVRVHAIGARLTDEIDHDMYNYGQLQVVFDDGSVGWYESGWGPMISETAFFVKDIVGPKGCVSIVSPKGDSTDLETHTSTNRLRIHHSELARDGSFDREDEIIDMSDEPDHQGLCDREQRFFLKAIEQDLDLTEHLDDAVNSLRIVVAADRSFRTGQVVEL